MLLHNLRGLDAAPNTGMPPGCHLIVKSSVLLTCLDRCGVTRILRQMHVLLV